MGVIYGNTLVADHYQRVATPAAKPGTKSGPDAESGAGRASVTFGVSSAHFSVPKRRFDVEKLSEIGKTMGRLIM